MDSFTIYTLWGLFAASIVMTFFRTDRASDVSFASVGCVAKFLAAEASHRIWYESVNFNHSEAKLDFVGDLRSVESQNNCSSRNLYLTAGDLNATRMSDTLL
jgi:hypothetical protein